MYSLTEQFLQGRKSPLKDSAFVPFMGILVGLVIRTLPPFPKDQGMDHILGFGYLLMAGK